MRVPRTTTAVRPRRAAGLGVWAIVLTVAAVVPAQADSASRVGVLLGGGVYKLAGGGSDHTRLGPWATTGVRFTWTRHFDVEASYRYGFNFDDSQTYRNRTTGVDLGVLYNAMPENTWTWQAFAGTGVFWWNVMDMRSGPNPDDPTDILTPGTGPFSSGPTANGFREDGNASRLADSNWKVYFGLGAETELFWNISFRVGARVDYLIRQHTDNTGASDTLRTGLSVAEARARVDANDLVGSVFGGFTLWFGKRDRDGDGIADRDDACPDEAEDLDGFQDEDGCPDPDNDNDGVADATDKCPNEAEDKDAFEDEDGCPDLDNDKDGIADAVDRCPTEAEDIDQFEDEDGCPDPDNDDDGVSDADDQCPDTPAGLVVDAAGCPLARTEQERQLQETGMIRLSGVRFDTGKFDIRPEFAARLDSVAAVLKSYPMLRLEIAGHTDSRGSDASNQTLSQRRAQAVLNYLKSKDPSLDASLYSVRGYGETVPIADNATEDGRALNRRVEFRVTNRAELDAEMQRRRTTVPPRAPAPETPATPTPPVTPAPADTLAPMPPVTPAPADTLAPPPVDDLILPPPAPGDSLLPTPRPS